MADEQELWLALDGYHSHKDVNCKYCIYGESVVNARVRCRYYNDPRFAPDSWFESRTKNKWGICDKHEPAPEREWSKFKKGCYVFPLPVPGVMNAPKEYPPPGTTCAGRMNYRDCKAVALEYGGWDIDDHDEWDFSETVKYNVIGVATDVTKAYWGELKGEDRQRQLNSRRWRKVGVKWFCSDWCEQKKVNSPAQKTRRRKKALQTHAIAAASVAKIKQPRANES